MPDMGTKAIRPREYDSPAPYPRNGVNNGGNNPTSNINSTDENQNKTKEETIQENPDINPRYSSNENSREYWEKMDKMFLETFAIAKKTYNTNRMINILVVGIGIGFIINSFAYSWINGAMDQWSALMGGMGLASFVSLFFVKTQQRIRQSLSVLAKIQMIYRSFTIEHESLSDHYFVNLKLNHSNFEEILQTDKELERMTEYYLELTKKHIEDVK